MKLSAPIYRLKRQAKILSRKEKIPLYKALDCIAKEEGFNSWSLLISKTSADRPVIELLNFLNPGDLVLLGARPGHGKTLMGLELIIESIKRRKHGIFFTLEYNARDVLEKFPSLAGRFKGFKDNFEFYNSDSINSHYILDRLKLSSQGSIVVIDYLQLLDQKRENQELSVQVSMLKAFAIEKGIIFIFLSQIDRSYELSDKSIPDMQDVRLPNPVDLKMFNKSCFLNNGQVQIEIVS